MGSLHAETERIKQLVSGRHSLLAFSFWTGKLPEISRLHFLTVARTLPEGSRYVLFTHKAVIASSMSRLLADCEIDVVPIDLPALLRENGLGKLLRRTPLSQKWSSLRRTANSRPRLGRVLAKPFRLGHYHPILRFTPRYNVLLGGPPANGVLLSNYLRVVVSSLIETDTLYMDIDFAFPRALDWIYEHGSFVYDWERRGFANSALMFVRAGSQAKEGVMIELLRREGTGKCCILFSEDNCRTCGLAVLSCDRLDPLWSTTYKGSPKFLEFFTRNVDSEETRRVLMRDFDAIHWHNQWNRIPDRGSPYEVWLRELTSQSQTENQPVEQPSTVLTSE